jgi:tRNA nucleotidyltransferase/poly(A) polymerase
MVGFSESGGFSPEFKNTIETRIQELLDSMKKNSELDIMFNIADQDGVEVYLVGGSVRDAVMNAEAKDFDFVVRGIELNELQKYLNDSGLGKAVLAGENSFGVLKFTPEGAKEELDIALPRTEESTGEGSRDFKFGSDPNLPVEEDLARRDLTINAMALDIKTGKMMDPFGGIKDLQEHKLDIVHKEGEDPGKRIDEDASRLARTLRFLVKHGICLDIDSINEEVLHSKMHYLRERKGDGKRRVPLEVVCREVLKMLHVNPINTIEVLNEFNVLNSAVEDPNDFDKKGVEKKKGEIIWTKEKLQNLKDITGKMFDWEEYENTETKEEAEERMKKLNKKLKKGTMFKPSAKWSIFNERLAKEEAKSKGLYESEEEKELKIKLKNIDHDAPLALGIIAQNLGDKKDLKDFFDYFKFVMKFSPGVFTREDMTEIIDAKDYSDIDIDEFSDNLAEAEEKLYNKKAKKELMIKILQKYNPEVGDKISEIGEELDQLREEFKPLGKVIGQSIGKANKICKLSGIRNTSEIMKNIRLNIRNYQLENETNDIPQKFVDDLIQESINNN